jgi:polyferredoxin
VLPFVRWTRGPGQPEKAVLLDIEIWPQEVHYLTGLPVRAALVLVWLNAGAGHAWCGYFCPQTVWTDVFLHVASPRVIAGNA